MIVAIGAVGTIGYAVFEKQNVSEDVTNTSAINQIVRENEDDEDSDDDKLIINPIVTPTPSQDKPVSNVKTFTMLDVATHADVTSCYSVVNGSVYDLTSWISKHPGGEAAIKSICGKDGTDGFNSQHAGKSKPEFKLSGFKIGVLVQ